jgi:hypothetical protein
LVEADCEFYGRVSQPSALPVHSSHSRRDFGWHAVFGERRSIRSPDSKARSIQVCRNSFTTRVSSR